MVKVSETNPVKVCGTGHRDHAIHGGPWNSEVNELSIKQAQRFVQQLADELHEAGDIGEFPQRYIV